MPHIHGAHQRELMEELRPALDVGAAVYKKAGPARRGQQRRQRGALYAPYALDEKGGADEGGPGRAGRHKSVARSLRQKALSYRHGGIGFFLEYAVGVVLHADDLRRVGYPDARVGNPFVRQHLFKGVLVAAEDDFHVVFGGRKSAALNNL